MSYDFTMQPDTDHPELFEDNVTYNLGQMLRRAGFHPKVVAGMTAEELRPVVRHAYFVMLDNPDYFKKFNAENGWGNYHNAMHFMKSLHEYLASCPDGYVMKVS